MLTVKLLCKRRAGWLERITAIPWLRVSAVPASEALLAPLPYRTDVKIPEASQPLVFPEPT